MAAPLVKTRDRKRSRHRCVEQRSNRLGKRLGRVMEWPAADGSGRFNLHAIRPEDKERLKPGCGPTEPFCVTWTRSCAQARRALTKPIALPTPAVAGG